MSTKTLTRKAVADAAREVETAKGKGVSLALRNYVRTASVAAEETGASAAVHGMHAARAVFLYASQTDGDGFLFGTKTGRVNVTQAWAALVGDEVAGGQKTAPRGLSRRMFANHYKRGQRLSETVGLGDLQALEEHALEVFRGEAKRQRGNTGEKQEERRTTDDPQVSDTVTESLSGKDGESVGDEILSTVTRLTRAIRAANGRLTEAEHAAIRSALEQATAALSVIRPAATVAA